jgi:hypothetical protein
MHNFTSHISPNARECYANQQVSITDIKNVSLFTESSRKEIGLTSLNIRRAEHYYCVCAVISFLADECHIKHYNYICLYEPHNNFLLTLSCAQLQSHKCNRMLCTVHLPQPMSVCPNLLMFRNKGSYNMRTASKQCAVSAAVGHSQMTSLFNKCNAKIMHFFIKLLSEKVSRNLNFKLLTTSRPMVTICTTTETLQHPINIIYVFHMSLTINSIHFSIQYQTPGLSKASRLCSLQGSNWSSKCVIQMSISLQRVKKKVINKHLCIFVRVVIRQVLYMKIL